MIHNNEAERAIISTILAHNDAIYRVADTLPPEAFFDPLIRFIYECALEVADSSKVDMVTVTEKAMSKKEAIEIIHPDVSIAYEIASLSDGIFNINHIEEHQQILMKYYTKRKMYEMGKKIASDIESNEPLEKLISEAADIFMEATSTKKVTEVDIAKALDEFVINQQKGVSEKLMPTYIPEVDSVIGGAEYSDLVIVAGAASMGKTSFMLKLLQNLVNNDKSISIFSLEMSNNQLLTRLLAMETEINIRKIRYNDLDGIDWGKINRVIDIYKKKNFILDSETVELQDILNKLRKQKIKNNIDVVFIDYLQLIRDSKSRGNREQEVAKIARSLKNIAKELNIVVVALSQLSRAVSNRDDKRPMLSDLRESGEIEQAADTVMLMYRAGYYDLEDTRDIQEAEVIIAKGRNSGTGLANIMFNRTITKFISPAELENRASFVPNPDMF
jgi:replicative DNA helicase